MLAHLHASIVDYRGHAFPSRIMHSQTEKPLILKLSQVALLLGVCEKTVRRAIHDGKLTAYRHRSGQVVKPDDLQDYVDNLKPVRRVKP